MVSSDDEDDNLPSSVENYHFEDDKKEPVSFSVLPVQWRVNDEPGDTEAKIFLRGDFDKGLIKIYKPVVAWRFDLSNVKPKISVRLKGKHWIKLDKPRKSYEAMIRSALVTVNCLHFVVKNPESSGKYLWDSLSKDYGSFEVRPSENDLVDHTSLISEAVKRDNALAKSKFLAEFLKEKPGKRKLPAEEAKAKPMSQFIVSDSDDDMADDGDEDESDEEEGMFDSVCAICDNGGALVCCEGSCLRSFHQSADDDPDCESLGLTKEEVQATAQFLCKNCELKRHQCAVCGKLGSSDKYSGAEVFQCVSATCGHFFHPRCVSKLIHEDNKCSADELEKKIKEGESFTCPAHKCCVCKRGENKKDDQLQFAVCRRCPKSYHRKCLPKEIIFAKDVEDEDETTALEDDKDEDEEFARAWEGLLPNRILIYCLMHEIDENLKTPIRDHLRFPGVEGKKGISSAKKKTIRVEKKPKQKPVGLGDKKKTEMKTETPRRERKASEFKQSKEPSSAPKVEDHRNSGKLGSGPSRSRRAGSVKMEPKSKRAEKSKQSLGYGLFSMTNKDSESDEELNNAATVPLDAESEKRVLDIMKSVESSITIEKVKEKLRVPYTHGNSQKSFEERSITVGKVQNAVEAVKAALKSFDNGEPEDAEAVCDKGHLRKIHRWRNKFKVYLAPFLHGMRYTSFGRHFTQPEKLQEIANKLHWYVKDGDMVVDFCCGSNDFSCFMNTKLGEMKKKCSFRNYDIMPTANDFNFVKQDWTTVKPKDLPDGSKLIMGLNPPFGIRGALANVFIDKALEFKPKLLILIAPDETERLDQKKTPYDLVWEDNHMLGGKSFYLPGSSDVKDKLLTQWNIKPPLLYLWSRPDWTARHKVIAEKQGHMEEIVGRGPVSPDCPIDTRNRINDNPIDDNINNDWTDMDDGEKYNPVPTDNPVDAENSVRGYEPEEQNKESSSLSDGGSHENHGKKPFGENSRKRGWSGRGWKNNKKREIGRDSTDHNHNQNRDGGFRSSAARDNISPRYTTEHNVGREIRSSPGISPRMTEPIGRVSTECNSHYSPRISPHYVENINRRDEPYVPCSPSQIGARSYGGGPVFNYRVESYEERERERQLHQHQHVERERLEEWERLQQRLIMERDEIHLRKSVRNVRYETPYEPENLRQLPPLGSGGYANVGPPMAPTAGVLHRRSMSAFAVEPLNVYPANGRFILGHPGPPPPPPPESFDPGHHYQSFRHHGTGGWFDHPGL